MVSDNIINGKEIAAEICKDLQSKIELLKNKYKLTPGLAVILLGDDPASKVYVGSKDKKAKLLGIHSQKINLPADISENELLDHINELNNNSDIHGILVQLPLPKHIDKNKIINAIDPEKDVDGFHIINAGKLFTNQKSLVSCTPLGCLTLIKKTIGEDLSGLNAVIIGRSNIVGKPMAELLLHENCTVTITHSRTKDIKSHCQRADIIVAAVGIAKFVKADWVREGAVVIDVGINKVGEAEDDRRLVGDVDFDNVQAKVRGITPVPGGVGPMTIACLMKNTVIAAIAQNNLTSEIEL
jgi:methylenetetrahydrofolate dehydrogenase (NADP+) / methenyltetrahydrofolate cyclohydrolase